MLRSIQFPSYIETVNRQAMETVKNTYLKTLENILLGKYSAFTQLFGESIHDTCFIKVQKVMYCSHTHNSLQYYEIT